MKNGVCIKCGAEDVYKAQEAPYRRSAPADRIFAQGEVLAYICCSCGYMEEYTDSPDGRYFERVREKGEKISVHKE